VLTQVRNGIAKLKTEKSEPSATGETAPAP